MTATGAFRIALLGGDKPLREAVRGAVPDGVELEFLDSVLEVASLGSGHLLLVPEMLSECSGLELVKLLKAHQQSPPKLFLIAVDQEMREEAFKSGVDDYLSVPIGHELTAKLKRLSSGSGSDLAGSLVSFPPMSLVQFLFTTKVTGRLLVCGSNQFVLYFNLGELIEARHGQKNGESVVMELLRMDTEGCSFEFFREDIRGMKKSILRRTDHLLLSLASSLDEGR